MREIMLASILALTLLPLPAEAAPILWQYSGTVTSSQVDGSGTGLITPGTYVEMDWWFDPAALASPTKSCLYPNATPLVTIRILGGSYSASGVTWVDGYGFGPGICSPAGDTGLEIITGIATTPTTLAGQAVNVGGGGWLPGFWGDDNNNMLPTAPPLFLTYQSPGLFFPANGEEPSRMESFHASLTPVPEPSTLLLLGTGVVATRLRRRRR